MCKILSFIVILAGFGIGLVAHAAGEQETLNTAICSMCVLKVKGKGFLKLSKKLVYQCEACKSSQVKVEFDNLICPAITEKNIVAKALPAGLLFEDWIQEYPLGAGYYCTKTVGDDLVFVPKMAGKIAYEQYLRSLNISLHSSANRSEDKNAWNPEVWLTWQKNVAEPIP